MPQQPDTLQQKPHGAFKPRKLLALLAAVLLSILVAGTGGYLQRIRNTQSILLLPSSTPQTTIKTILPENSIIVSFNVNDMFGNPYFSRLVAIDPTGRSKEQIVYKLEDPRDEIVSMKWSPNRKKLAFGFIKHEIQELRGTVLHVHELYMRHM